MYTYTHFNMLNVVEETDSSLYSKHISSEKGVLLNLKTKHFRHCSQSHRLSFPPKKSDDSASPNNNHSSKSKMSEML